MTDQTIASDTRAQIVAEHRKADHAFALVEHLATLLTFHIDDVDEHQRADPIKEIVEISSAYEGCARMVIETESGRVFSLQLVEHK